MYHGGPEEFVSKVTLLLAGLSLASLSMAGPILYGIDDSNNSLITIDRSTFAISVVGSTGIGSGDFGDLTYDSNDGIMYWSAGRGNNDIYTLNLSTGAATLAGATGLTDLFGLGYDTTNDTLYGATASGGGENLYSINVTTGAPTLIGNTGIYANGLVYRSDTNTLYETNSTSLYSLNLSNGAATLLSTLSPGTNDSGITWDPILGVWWIDDWDSNVYQVDSAFTTLTTVQTYTDPLDGIALVGATSAATPEPGTMGLMAAGLGLAALLRRRRA